MKNICLQMLLFLSGQLNPNMLLKFSLGVQMFQFGIILCLTTSDCGPSAAVAVPFLNFLHLLSKSVTMETFFNSVDFMSVCMCV